MTPVMCFFKTFKIWIWGGAQGRFVFVSSSVPHLFTPSTEAHAPLTGLAGVAADAPGTGDASNDEVFEDQDEQRRDGGRAKRKDDGVGFSPIPAFERTGKASNKDATNVAPGITNETRNCISLVTTKCIASSSGFAFVRFRSLYDGRPGAPSRAAGRTIT